MHRLRPAAAAKGVVLAVAALTAGLVSSAAGAAASLAVTGTGLKVAVWLAVTVGVSFGLGLAWTAARSRRGRDSRAGSRAARGPEKKGEPEWRALCRSP